MSEVNFVYFGGEPLGVPVLEELKAAGYLPKLIVASPDRKSGRGQKLTPPPVKVWAEENNITVWQPENFKDQAQAEEKLADFDLFIVVAYNHILPEWLINLPEHKTLNVHPSLLPLLRGASPIRSAILRDMKDEIGVSLMQLDKKMDHGPIITQQHLNINEEDWPVRGPELDRVLAHEGGRLLAATIKGYVSGDLVPQEQEHEYATYCGRFEKSEGELDINPTKLPSGDIAYQTLLKIYALMGSPNTFFINEGKRVKINDATLENNQLKLTQVTPEGKGKQSFTDYLKSI